MYCIFVILSASSAQTLDQIRQAKKTIKQLGMSEIQVREAAKTRGYSDKQINDAIKKKKSQSVDEIKPGIESSGNNLSIHEKSNKVINNQIIEDVVDASNIEDINDEIELEIHSEAQPDFKKASYFGYEIFKRDPALFQASSVGAVDPEYLIGPGDEIIIMLWGETEFRQDFTVDREGFVFIPEVGKIFVNGLDLNLLESKLFKIFSQSYASLSPQDQTPTSFLDVSLGTLRPLRIQVLGEVAQPGAYTVSPSATLFSSLYYFNGPTNLGSLRDIQLIRGGKKIVSIDFYDYLLSGKKLKDKKLQLDDVIYIPRRLKTVSIVGEINREGVYELKQGEGLADLIAIAGDLKITAYLDRSQIDRIVPFHKRKEIPQDRMFIDVNLEKVLKSEDKFKIEDGDHVHIFSILDNRQNMVSLRGAVTRPGRYEIGESLYLNELIDNADGILGDAYLDRAEIFRVNEDFSKELIQINLKKALENDTRNNIKLQGLDSIRIYGGSEMVSKTSVSIFGHVKNEGSYFLHENMKLYDLIFKAGGFEDEEFRKKTFLERVDLFRMNDDGITRSIKSFNLDTLINFPASNQNIDLNPYDKVIIYGKDLFISNKPISISGVIRNPGNYELKTKMSLKDLILEAGGLDKNIYRFKAEIARIDPLNEDLNKYADLIELNMDKNFNLIYSENENLNSISQFYLEPYDLVHLRSNPYFVRQKIVKISGEVLYPGDYVLSKSDEKITDIIKRAGGLLSNAYPEASKFTRKGVEVDVSIAKILKNPSSILNVSLLENDAIKISSKPNIVAVIGEVNKSKGNTTLLKYIPKKRLNYYINLSGGFTKDADKNNIWVEYANGVSKERNRYLILSPMITDGSSIYVGRKKDSKPFDKTEFAKEVTSIFANLSQLLVTILIIIRSA